MNNCVPASIRIFHPSAAARPPGRHPASSDARAEFKPSPALSLPLQFRNQASRANRKRRRAAAVQDAVALATVVRASARFWSAPPLRRFRFSRQIHGLNSRQNLEVFPLHEPPPGLAAWERRPIFVPYATRESPARFRRLIVPSGSHPASSGKSWRTLLSDRACMGDERENVTGNRPTCGEMPALTSRRTHYYVSFNWHAGKSRVRLGTQIPRHRGGRRTNLRLGAQPPGAGPQRVRRLERRLSD